MHGVVAHSPRACRTSWSVKVDEALRSERGAKRVTAVPRDVMGRWRGCGEWADEGPLSRDTLSFNNCVKEASIPRQTLASQKRHSSNHSEAKYALCSGAPAALGRAFLAKETVTLVRKAVTARMEPFCGAEIAAIIRTSVYLHTTYTLTLLPVKCPQL